uniref:Pentatricopeptide repeat-containing protein n=1 Tax=Tanacetum cinerariifolium TaxID=118510 RepID=A0A6L2NQV4_TANCI|nr:hypothetical protein [Tanacetum cinerariifolium]
MPQRILTAFNYMIAGYMKNGEVGQSLNLSRRLVLCGERPDGYTLSMVLKALSCGNMCGVFYVDDFGVYERRVCGGCGRGVWEDG